MLTETIVQYTQQIDTNEYCMQELSNQLRESKRNIEELAVEKEKNQLLVSIVIIHHRAFFQNLASVDLEFNVN